MRLIKSESGDSDDTDYARGVFSENRCGNVKGSARRKMRGEKKSNHLAYRRMI